MSMNSRFLTVGLVAALVGVAAAADDATQTIKAGASSFKAPATWKKETPKSAMRKAQIKVAPAEGDDEPAELVVTAFPGGAGGRRGQHQALGEASSLTPTRRPPRPRSRRRRGSTSTSPGSRSPAATSPR